jgi:hypothetical protein
MGRLLCWLGWHEWGEWRHTHGQAWITRVCSRCEVMHIVGWDGSMRYIAAPRRGK